MPKNLTTIPRINTPNTQEGTIEWQIPEQVSVALTKINEQEYMLMGKVKVEKKHFWDRSWKTFGANATSASETIKKGKEVLENYGYTIDYDG